MKVIIITAILACFMSILNAQWQNLNCTYSGTVTRIATIGSNIFVGTNGSNAGVFLSTNDGGSWSKVFTSSIAASIAINGNNIFAGTNHGGVWKRPLSDFGIVIPTQTIPTLSQWSLIFLGLLLLGAGTFYIVRRRRTEISL